MDNQLELAPWSADAAAACPACGQVLYHRTWYFVFRVATQLRRIIRFACADSHLAIHAELSGEGSASLHLECLTQPRKAVLGSGVQFRIPEAIALSSLYDT